MGKIVEYALISADGIFSGEATRQFFQYRDDAYYRDGLGQLLASEAMLLGRTTYETFAKIWPGREHPWAERLNEIPKYVFTSTLEEAGWSNSTIVRGDVVAEVKKIKQKSRGDLLIYGHGLLARTFLEHHLLDALDLSVYPLFLGCGEPLFREGEAANLRLVTTKSFSGGIVKLTYEPQN